MIDAAMRSLPAGRLAGLDGWRGGLMVLGIVLHASTWLEPRPFFVLTELVSHTFRMGAFFAVSGFLAARALNSRSGRAWLGRRMIQIGIPGVLGLTVLCPAITLAVARMPGQHGAVYFQWHHLWFLVALLLYAPLALIADRIDRHIGLWARMSEHYSPDKRSLISLLVGTGLFSLLLMLLSSMVAGSIGTTETMLLLSQCRLIATYWPDYLLGFAVARSFRFQAAMLHDWRSPTLMLGSVALGYMLWFGVIAPRSSVELRIWGNGMVPLIGTAFAPAASFSLILRSAARIERIGRWPQMLADASFTIYLIHLPIIAALSLLFAWIGWDPHMKFITIVGVTAILSFAFHLLLVKRSALLSLLFCGQLPSTLLARPLRVSKLRSRGSSMTCDQKSLRTEKVIVRPMESSRSGW